MRTNIYTLVRSATFIAIIFLMIYFFRLPNGFGGFIHFGDSLIFVAAALLPFPFNLFVAALGPGLFNLAAEGGAIWFPFTIVIKPIMALCFTSRGDTILGPLRNRVAPFAAAGINTVLYFFANMILFGGFGGGVAALPGLLVQGVGSIVAYFVIAVALDRLKIKRMFKS
ncbi:MAG: TIGR04002 family protein [Defluviitaleaceae bacterium]|nr:TIGR04002 family protein [Defluviitaleaceae bacterium]